jgi:hypothetical protein
MDGIISGLCQIMVVAVNGVELYGFRYYIAN